MLFTFLLSSTTTFAATVNVTGNNFSDIQYAVDLANNGDIIDLGNGTYYGYNNTITINKNNLIIQGSSPSSRVTLDANNTGSIFQTLDGSYNITFKNINFTNGNSTTEKGSAINAKNTINVENCTFTNNKGASGAAIYLNSSASNSIIIDSTFSNNRAMYNNSNLEYPEGGAIDSHASNTLIQNCNFNGNSAIHDAGAVSFAHSTNNTIINSTFTNNNAANNGGGISVRLSELIIIDSRFQGNSALIGSAIYNDPSSTLNINNTTFSNNCANTFDIIAQDYIFNRPGFVIIQISLVVGDNVIDAIYNEGFLTINNTIPNETEYATNQNINLKFNNTVYTNTTDINGIATFNINITDFSLMLYNYTVEHPLTSLYTNISKNSTILITENYTTPGPIQGTGRNNTIVITPGNCGTIYPPPIVNPPSNPQSPPSNSQSPPFAPQSPPSNLPQNPNTNPNDKGSSNTNTMAPTLCDLKVDIIANPNPVKQGFMVTYTIYIENLGSADAYNLIVSSNLPRIGNLTYSFSGTEWYKWTGSLKIDKLSKNQMMILYINGILPQSFIGKIENNVEVSSSTPESDYSNNKVSLILNVDEDIDPYICGPVALQTLLASKGIFVSLDVLKEKLKPVGGMTSMAMMKQVASEYGVGLNPVKISVNDLKKGDIALLTINGIGHYVTIQSIDNEYVVYNDPIYGMVKVTRAEFERLYSGYALSEGNEEKEIPKEEQEELKGGFFVVDDILLLAGAATVILGLLAISTQVDQMRKGNNNIHDPFKGNVGKKIEENKKDPVPKSDGGWPELAKKVGEKCAKAFFSLGLIVCVGLGVGALLGMKLGDNIGKGIKNGAKLSNESTNSSNKSIKTNTKVVTKVLKPVAKIVNKVTKPVAKIVNKVTKPVAKIVNKVTKPVAKIVNKVTKPVVKGITSFFKL